MTIELLESQQGAAAGERETMRAASAAHVRTSVALRLVALAASLAAAVVVATNRQDRWGITVSFRMFAVWEAFVAISFAFAAYSALTAIFVKKLISKHWLHHIDLVPYIISVHAFISLFFSPLYMRSPSCTRGPHRNAANVRTFAMQLTVNLQAASTAGAGAVGSVAMWGNEPSGWYPVCRLYRLYCGRGAVALALAFVSVVALGVAATLSRFPRAPPSPPASR
ncbi:hypothetical protein BAE44_0020941 [Dichanthelium oligosanthes]|uniref:CASP-like protein n=1 Tax=Dichanthelium oligosanthes TaxID=888268 RepID=A0A1E5UYR7_9POAL|nr:hypothetical protein BAE44_0020941 [Dichanthelium oligosanthes]